MSPTRRLALLLMIGIIPLGGCASRKVQAPEAPGEALVVLLPDPETGHVGRAHVSNPTGRVELTAARDSTVVSSRKAPTPTTQLEQGNVRGLFGDVLSALPPPQRHFTLFFRFDSETLTDESRALTQEIVRTIKERRGADVLVVGHTDTTGARARNFELGLRRANTVRTMLKETGLDPTSIDVISHGESELLIPTEDGVFEARNRRVEITVR